MAGQLYTLDCFYKDKQSVFEAELLVYSGCVVIQRVLSTVPSTSYTKIRGVHGIINMTYSAAIGLQAMHYSFSTSNYISMMYAEPESSEEIFRYEISDHLMTTIDLPPKEYGYVNRFEYLVNSGYYFSQMMIVSTRTYFSTIVSSNAYLKLQSQLIVLKYGKFQKHYLTIESDVSQELHTSSSVMYFKMIKASCKRLENPHIKASIMKLTPKMESELYTVFQLLDSPIYIALIEQNYVTFTYVILNQGCSIHLKYHTEYLNVNNIRSCNQIKVCL